jgi:hypothetical protein
MALGHPIARVGSTLAVKALAVQAITAVGVDLDSMSDPQAQEAVDGLSDAARAVLGQLDAAFYDAVDDYMDRCWDFVKESLSHLAVG